MSKNGGGICGEIMMEFGLSSSWWDGKLINVELDDDGVVFCEV